MVILENQWGRSEIRPQGAQVLTYIPTYGRNLVCQFDAIETRQWWPFSFFWEHEITLGPTLELGFSAWNREAAPVDFEMVWHTYFAVDEISRARVSGLEGCSYLDKNRSRAPGGQIGAIDSGAVSLAPDKPWTIRLSLSQEALP